MSVSLNILKAKTIKFLVFFTLFIPVNSFSANFYWVNGTGNWSDYANHWATSSGGSTFQIQVPSPIDNVIFDVNSFANPNDTVILDTTLIYANNLIYDNALPVLLYAPSAITIEISETIDLDPGLKLEGGTSNLNLRGTGIYNFRTSEDTLRIAINFMSSGDYSLSEDLHTGDLFITDGKFRTNNHSVFADYRIRAAGTSEIFFGSSNMHAYIVFFFPNTTYVIHAENSTFYCADFTSMKAHLFNDVYCTNKFNSSYSDYHNVEAIWFQGGLGNFHNVKIKSSLNPSIFSGAQSNFNKIEIEKGIYTGSGNLQTDTLIIHVGTDYSFRDSITINKLFQSSGNCTQYNSLSGWDSFYKGHIIMNTGSYYLDYNSFSNISFSGGLTFSANNSFNLGSAIGISISNPVAKKLYWIGGSGNWDNETHWSLSSGAPADNCLPTKLDTVVFDNNSFLNYHTVTITSNSSCKTLIWNSNDTVLIKNQIAASELTIYQSLIIDNPSTIILNLPHLHFVSDQPGNTILTNDALINSYIDFIGMGEWSFNSAFTNLDEILIKGGTFRTNGHRIKSSLIDFDLDRSSAFYMASSLMETGWHFENQTHPMIIDATNTDFIRSNVNSDIPIHCRDFIDCGNVKLAANSSFRDMEIKFLQLNASCSGRNVTVTDYQINIANIIINGAILNKLTIDTRACNLVGLNAYVDTLISTRSGLSLTLYEINIDNFLKLIGSCDGNIILTGNAHIFGTTQLQNILFRNVVFTGNIPVTPLNSIFDGVNQGITTNNYISRTLYWVNGSGNWGDSNHWSLTSGGSGGECIPSRFDDIVIDSLSQISGYLEITLNYLLTECRSFTDVRQCMIIDDNHASFINIYGNFRTDSLFTARVNYDYPITLVCDSGINFIDSRSEYLQRSIELKGRGSFELLNDLRTEKKLFLRMGQLKTNGFPITVNDHFQIFNNDPMSLYMDTSTITCSNFNFLPIANSSVLDFDNCIILSDNFSATDLDLNIVRTGYLTCYTCTGNSFTATNINLDSSTVNELSTTALPGTCALANSSIEKFEINNISNRLSGTTQIDTLIFNSPGQDLLLDNFNISVTRHLELISDAGFPSRLKTNIQFPCNINYSGDTLCTDFVYFENIAVTGSAPWFVGANSFDLGGNTGLNFIACPVINNITSADLMPIVLYPNPVTSRFVVTLPATINEEMTFVLYDLLGNVVIQKSIEGLTTEINRDDQANGIYIYQLKNNQGNSVNSGKMVFN
ncbi:MAG: T9SS type A sorting domain-containing protein [Bacteroidetes bacterium]|nr:T9SS type A sorting domain-containing protein [Bacteroidota bacterium]